MADATTKYNYKLYFASTAAPDTIEDKEFVCVSIMTTYLLS